MSEKDSRTSTEVALDGIVTKTPCFGWGFWRRTSIFSRDAGKLLFPSVFLLSIVGTTTLQPHNTRSPDLDYHSHTEIPSPRTHNRRVYGPRVDA